MDNDAIKNKGVVFTPAQIAQYMVSMMEPTRNQKVLEPSCGEGSILKYIPKYHKITGLDINPLFVKTCKNKYPYANIIQTDFLKYNIPLSEHYDCIIGNPPYVKIQNINPVDVDQMRKEYPKFMQGNTNLYVYFLLKCMDLLKPKGCLIFLIPNTLLYNKSIRPFWQNLLQQHQVQHVIDFRDSQIFDGVSTYTCIVHLTKQSSTYPYYLYRNGLNSVDKKIPFKQRKNSKSQVFRARIGLMTLRDDVFIIREWKINNNNISFTRNDRLFTIEAGACRDILKVSKNQYHKIIYPYVFENDKTIIDKRFKNKFPKAYHYLETHKSLLDKRDSGHVSDYSAWYAYGRTQSISVNNTKRLFLSSVVSGNKTLDTQTIETTIPLYYSGLWLEPLQSNISNDDILNWLQKHTSSIFKLSNLRSGGWYAITQMSFAV
jgi:type I restriction-modification system DNA methylase subunit